LCRRSYVGLELVQWLLEQCLFIQGRMVAARVWQILLELGILLSADQHIVFEDSNTFYQFSYDECETQQCEYKKEKEWQNGVRLLLQLVPYVQFRVGVISPPDREAEDKKEVCNEILKMKALERLTSTVQNELAVALARKARMSSKYRCRSRGCGGGWWATCSVSGLNWEHSASCWSRKVAMAWDCGLKYLFHLSPTLQAGGVCAIRDKEDLSGIEMVQRLAKDGCRFLQTQNSKVTDRTSEPHSDEASRVRLKERGQDVLVLQRVSSERPAPPASAGGGREEEKDRRYVVVSGTPEKILEHLLSDLRLDESQGPPSKETEMETHVFKNVCNYSAHLKHICTACSQKCMRGKEEGKEALYRKRKVLHLVSQWTALYRDFLREEEHVKLFIKTLYRYVLDDLYEYPSLEKDLKEFQKLLRMHRRHTVDEYSPHRKNKALFHQFSLKENWLQPRGTYNEAKEVFCHVYITRDSYLSVKTRVSVSAQELLRAVADKIECTEEEMVLVAVTFPGEKRILQPHDSVYSESLTITGRLVVCRKDLSEIMNPFTDNEEVQPRAVRMLSMNTWDVAVTLTNFDWSLFNCVHEQELIYYTFSRQAGGQNTAGLELLLQRCNEVQLWVMTEVLLCSQLGKRVQLLKKFIKIAAHNAVLKVFFRLAFVVLSFQKVPGKFKKLFSELELLTDPSLNHKAYRDTFKKMKPPKIPFMPLLLKDITFIHEGNKTFLDNLVNFEKLHMIADTVRLIRHCQTDQIGTDGTQKDNQDVKSYVQHLHVIDNQQTLFELSHRLEPRA
ncbi:RPGF5 factor, partial [Amia calva]|nr:RPGF5 factor [Amia calva]